MVGVADNPFDAIERCELFGRALRIASGNEDTSAMIRGMNVADRIARLRVGGSGDGACVQDDDFRVAMIALAHQSAIEHLPLNRGGVRVRRAATEVFDGKSCQGRSTTRASNRRVGLHQRDKKKRPAEPSRLSRPVTPKAFVYEDPCGFSIFFCLMAFTLSTRSSAIFSSCS